MHFCTICENIFVLGSAWKSNVVLEKSLKNGCNFLREPCISCVVQQRSRVKDLFSLVGYDDSCLAAIRHVKRIIRILQLRPNIRSHSVLLEFSNCAVKKSQIVTRSVWSGFLCFFSHEQQKDLPYCRVLFRVTTAWAHNWLPSEKFLWPPGYLGYMPRS